MQNLVFDDSRERLIDGHCRSQRGVFDSDDQEDPGRLTCKWRFPASPLAT